MEFTFTFLNQPASKESLTITKKIGEGKFNVYHAHCPSQKADYALKVFPKDAFGATQYRKELILTNLSHSNIIKSIPANIESAQASDFHIMLTEFAKYGDFFELVVGGVFNSETLIRTYFHQLIAGLEYMHSQGVAHLDLKLENLMMGSGFNLKIIDFDQAQRTTDKKLTSGGTKAYRAPEILDSSCTNFTAADVYSAGVILYAFKAREYPFAEVTTNKSISLKYYSTFLRNNEAFWEMKSNLKKDSSFFDESFKELVNGMLEYNVERRLTIEDIKKSKWYNGPVLNEKLLRSEMRARWENFTGGKSC